MLRRREAIVWSFFGLRKGYLLRQLKLKKGTLRKQLQYSPKIMHAQELLFASASPQLLAPSCVLLAVGFCKTQELRCG